MYQGIFRVTVYFFQTGSYFLENLETKGKNLQKKIYIYNDKIASGYNRKSVFSVQHSSIQKVISQSFSVSLSAYLLHVRYHNTDFAK